jgi:hypothetical protein
MKTTFCLFFFVAAGACQGDLVAWWKGSDIRDAMGRNRITFLGGTVSNRGAFEFSGSLADAAWAPDAAEFAITGSLSVSCRVYPRAYASPFATSPQSQIVFRGDDRSGHDPYHITLSRDGFYSFSIDGGSATCTVYAPARLNKWVHLLGVFDVPAGSLRLYVDGRLVDEEKTAVRPIGQLDALYHPGVSIGNTQFPQGGRHSQPFDGLIRDVRIYNSAVTPRQAMR